MTFQANLNPNGDLLVVVDETVCVAVPKAELKKGKSWLKDDLIPAIEASVCPRMEMPIGPLGKDTEKALADVCDAALKG